jgi:hypothetical protein
MSDEPGGPGDVDWEHVGRLELHQRRFGLLQILSIDGGRTLSPTECAYELQTDTADANYHMTVLKRSRLVRLVDSIKVRGAREHFYCLIDHVADDLSERLERRRKDE